MGSPRTGAWLKSICPADEKNFSKYILMNGEVAARLRAEMLMRMTGAKRAFFCVACPTSSAAET